MGSPESFAGILRNLSTDNAGWMAMHAREYVQKEREVMYEDIQKELQVCVFHAESFADA